MKVLVVDDHNHFRETAARLLTFLGHCPLQARDEHEAEAAFAQNAAEIELVLLDMYLGVCHGLTLATRLEATRPGVRVLFMSGYGEVALGTPELAGPRRHFIEKPFSLATLKQAVADVLARP
jgi:DNA-binding NtrC family response regulator